MNYDHLDDVYRENMDCFDDYCIEDCLQRAQVVTPDGIFEIAWNLSHRCVVLIREDVEPFRIPDVHYSRVTYQMVLEALGYSETLYTYRTDGDIAQPVFKKQIFQIFVERI